MQQPEVLVLEGITLGERVRLQRILWGWRQTDLAAVAGVTQANVSYLERNMHVHPAARRRILAALDLDDPYMVADDA